MTATIRPPASADPARPYLDAVRAALAGAPASTRDELLDDLAEHLAELAAEPGAPSLAERLGAPDVYAADLLASAGIDVGPPTATAAEPPEPFAERVRRWWSSRHVVAVRDFLPQLRPGWWVARGYLAVCALAAIGGEDAAVLPFPSLAKNGLLGAALALAVAVPASVALGRRGGRWWNVVATGAGIVAAAITAGAINDTQYVYTDVVGTTGVLVAPDGRVITNIWPYDGAGTPLDGVFLFDQDGLPIDVGPMGAHPPGSVVVPGLFPRDDQVWTYDERTGTERLEPAERPAVSVPQLTTTTTTATTAPTTSTTATTTAPPGP